MSLFAVVATVALGPKMQEGKPKLCSKSPFLSHHFVLKSAQPAARPQNARPGAARRSWLLGQNSERFREVLRLQLLRNSITWFWWDASLGDGTWQLKLTTKKSQKIPLWHSVTKITFVMNRNIQYSMKFDAMNRRICMNRKWPLEIGLSKCVWCRNIWTYLSNPRRKEQLYYWQCRHPEDLYAHLCLHHRKSNQCPEDSPDGNGMTWSEVYILQDIRYQWYI